VPDEAIWELLLSKLWREPSPGLICRLLCCSNADMAALVRRACKGSIRIVIRPRKCAHGVGASNPEYDIETFQQWMCHNGSMVRALELHPDFMISQHHRHNGCWGDEAWLERHIPALTAGLAAAPNMQELVLGSILYHRSLQQLLLALPQPSQLRKVSIFYAERAGNPQESLRCLPPTVETLHVSCYCLHLSDVEHTCMHTSIQCQLTEPPRKVSTVCRQDGTAGFGVACYVQRTLADPFICPVPDRRR
jgi:hypothetical protein